MEDKEKDPMQELKDQLIMKEFSTTEKIALRYLFVSIFLVFILSESGTIIILLSFINLALSVQAINWATKQAKKEKEQLKQKQ